MHMLACRYVLAGKPNGLAVFKNGFALADSADGYLMHGGDVAAQGDILFYKQHTSGQRYLADSDFVQIPVERLVSADYLSELASDIDRASATPSSANPNASPTWCCVPAGRGSEGAVHPTPATGDGPSLALVGHIDTVYPRSLGFLEFTRDGDTVRLYYGAAEGGRDYNVAELSERTLWETYMPPYEAAVRAVAEQTKIELSRRSRAVLMPSGA